MKRPEVISYFLSEMGEPTRFLEIGVGSGACGNKVKASLKWGVDPKPGKIPQRDPEDVYAKLFRQTSDDFFKELPASEKFDVVFIDGLHIAKQVYQDVLNALNHLTPRGMIILHDCNPENEAMQAVPRLQKHWNGNCWKAIVRLRSEHPKLFCRVIDRDQGLGVVIPRPAGKEVLELKLERPAFDLQYKDLEADRARLLGIVPLEEMYELREQAAS